jgi:hypothetical protein
LTASLNERKKNLLIDWPELPQSNPVQQDTHVQMQQTSQLLTLSDEQSDLRLEDATPDVIQKSALTSDNRAKPEILCRE